jgi:hypothetical protein
MVMKMEILLVKTEDCCLTSDGLSGQTEDGKKFFLNFHKDTHRKYVFRDFFNPKAKKLNLFVDDGYLGWTEIGDK